MTSTRSTRRPGRRALGLAVVLVALVATAGCPADPGSNLPRARSTTDLPDDSVLPQVKVMYLVPSDRPDRQLDVDGQIESSVAAMQSWLAAQSGGTRLRFDTSGGRLDIGFLRMPQSDASVAGYAEHVRDVLQQTLEWAGFDNPNKLYAVYYDGSSDFACGGAASPPVIVGNTAAVYLNGLAAAPVPCPSSPGAAGPEMLREIFGTLGATGDCVPEPTNAGCLDLADSAFMDPTPPNAKVPPGWP